jgi:malonate transporter
MSLLVETILFVFSLVAMGYLSGVTGYLKPQTGEGVAEFAVNVAMPMLLFRTMVSADFHGAAPWGLWAVYFTAVVVTWTIGHLITTRVFGRDSQAGVVGGVSSAFSNLVLLGIPFILGVLGQPGFEVLSLLISVHLPTMIMASIILFELFGRVGGERLQPLAVIKTFFSKISVNPLIYGILGGLLWRASGVELPALPTRIVGSIADIAGPVALFSMGLSLSRFGISGNVKPAFVLSLVKLILMPAVALGLAWLFGLPPLVAKVAIAAAALPSGVNSYLIASQFGTGQALASNQMTIATALAVFTTAFWLSMAQWVFG